jgi:hypothetical protein
MGVVLLAVVRVVCGLFAGRARAMLGEVSVAAADL